MQNNNLPPSHMAPQHYLHAGQEQQSAEEVDAFVNRATSSRYYDLEPLPGEFVPWGPQVHHPGTGPLLHPQGTLQSYSNPWDGQNQLPLVNPYTMQSQNGPYHPSGQYDNTYYPPSSTESTPPNGFVPYYIDTQHANISHVQQGLPSGGPGGPVSPYPAILSPSESNASLSDPFEAEQKRLRNTAASARFRAKKKKREQSLERASNERQALVGRLEGRVKELEEENKWLKDLVWEKRESHDRDSERLGRRKREIDGVDEDQGKKEGDRNDGVGTNNK